MKTASMCGRLLHGVSGELAHGVSVSMGRLYGVSGKLEYGLSGEIEYGVSMGRRGGGEARSSRDSCLPVIATSGWRW